MGQVPPIDPSAGFLIYPAPDINVTLDISSTLSTGPLFWVSALYYRGLSLGTNTIGPATSASLSAAGSAVEGPLSGFIEVSAIGTRQCESWEEPGDQGPIRYGICSINGLEGHIDFATLTAPIHYELLADFSTSQVLSENCTSPP